MIINILNTLINSLILAPNALTSAYLALSLFQTSSIIYNNRDKWICVTVVNLTQIIRALFKALILIQANSNNI
jgi:hypothetical protein